MKLQRALPWIAPALFAAALLWSLKAPSSGGPDIAGFAALPALEGGRVKPLDTIARTALLMIRGKQTLRVNGGKMSAAEWMLDALARPEAADAYRVFAVDDPDLLGMLGRERGKEKYFSLVELEPFLSEIEAQASHAQEIEAPQRSRFQTAVVHLRDRLGVYHRLKNTLQVEGTQDLSGEVSAYHLAVPAGVKAVKDHQSSARFDRRALERLNAHFERYRFLASAAYFRPVPPARGERPEDWSSMGETLLEAMRAPALPPAVMAYAEMLKAWRRRDGGSFNGALEGYRSSLRSGAPRTAAWAGYEALFDRAEPFYQGIVMYVAVLLLVCASWLRWPQVLGRSAWNLLLLAFAVHTAGLVARIVLQGRPPVTNLYSSAVFVGWVGVLGGVVLEKLQKGGFGALAASAIGFVTLVIAHNLTGQGDTMEMMRAVLDSNFWLATHVITITIGYGGTYLASALAHIFVARGLLGSLDAGSSKDLTRMTYGVVCFSLFFSFIGTVLGGIWADQSWGRFWGWDPKENGALLIVLWNAIILHARWGGFIRERGLAVMAVYGGIVTSLSWFGVNMLGIGLHSYGFMDKAFWALAGFVAVELVVAAVGTLPEGFWTSRRAGLSARARSPNA